MTRLLVTGVLGFTGQHLVRHLLETHSISEIVGTDCVEPPRERAFEYVKADLTELEDARRLISDIHPDCIYHLAGAHSSSDIGLMISVNVLGTSNLLESICQENRIEYTRVLIPGSASEYGAVDEHENPIPERHPPHPVTVYGLSKMMQSETGAFYHTAHGLDIVRTRTFNLIGPGQPTLFFAGSLIEQARRIKAEEQRAVFEAGNLFPVRDFLDARDAVRAYALIMQQGMAGEIYNVGSGRPCALEQVVHEVLAISKLDVPVQSVRERVRASDAPRVVADVTKLQALTEWYPEVSLTRSLCDMMASG